MGLLGVCSGRFGGAVALQRKSVGKVCRAFRHAGPTSDAWSVNGPEFIANTVQKWLAMVRVNPS